MADTAKTILITDDDQFLRDMYAIKFKEAGYEVTTSGSGDETLGLIKGGARPSIVTMDMIMPGLSGKDLLKTLKSGQIDPAYKPICVVLSNTEGPTDVEEATQLGADAYIVKAHTVPSEVVAQISTLSQKTA